MMQASEMIKEYRSSHQGAPLPTQRPPTPVPEVYKTVRSKMHGLSFCAIWMRGAFNVIVFQATKAVSLSQLTALSTTVPQSLTVPVEKRRHVPTRHGLRRSRIISTAAGNRQPIMSNCKLAGVLVTMQFVIGIFLTGLGFHLQALTSSLKMRDTPTWAGIPLTVTGLFGIIFVSCCHREYPGNCSLFIMKATSFVLSAIDVILCLCSAAFQATHLIGMTTYTDCTTTQNGDSFYCVCRIQSNIGDRVYDYAQLQCEQVFTLLYMFFVVSSVAGCLGAVFTFWYTILIWGSRYDHFYAGLRPNEDAMVPVFTKDS